MSVTYSTATKTARMNAVKDQIDSGTGAGKLKIGTTGMASTLATITLDDPCGSVTNGVLTLSGFPKTVSASDIGTAAAATITDSADNVIISGLTVGTSGTDIILDSTSITSGQNVTINASPTITHAT